MTINEIKREARRQGLAWDDVRGEFERLWLGEQLKRERANEVRQAAWFFHTAHTPASWPFWRHGFLSRYERRMQRSDYTSIRGHDTLWQEVSWHYPEYAQAGGCQALWDFLLSPYDKLPRREEVYEQALEVVAAAQRRERRGKNREKTAVPF